MTDGPHEPARQRPRLLLVEDDDDILFALNLWFELEDFDVTTAHDGLGLLKALRIAESSEFRALVPDVIVTDVRMPGFNGLDVLEAFRQAGCDTPVVVVSAFADPELEERVERLGDSAFLSKPLDPEELSIVVREMLRR